MYNNILSLSKLSVEEGVVILINKEKNWTSFDVVKKIKNLIKERFNIKKIKVGHSGTLDPLATGLLIICTGKFTKKISEIQGLHKTYSGEITLGGKTPSFDLETEIDQKFDLIGITKDKVYNVSKEFVGEIFQKPPLFSAIKVKGERLYKKARRGEKVNIKKRKITIYSFEITKINLPKIEFIINCSKGTYIRSIANDFGLKLKNGGYLSELTREKIGNYNLKDSLTISEFEKNLMRDIS
tara:strand:+ start:1032 stop:1751 length:720 start_codon:yes stop_codon:yes gene_type:complete